MGLHGMHNVDHFRSLQVRGRSWGECDHLTVCIIVGSIPSCFEEGRREKAVEAVQGNNTFAL